MWPYNSNPPRQKQVQTQLLLEVFAFFFSEMEELERSSQPQAVSIEDFRYNFRRYPDATLHLVNSAILKVQQCNLAATRLPPHLKIEVVEKICEWLAVRYGANDIVDDLAVTLIWCIVGQGQPPQLIIPPGSRIKMTDQELTENTGKITRAMGDADKIANGIECGGVSVDQSVPQLRYGTLRPRGTVNAGIQRLQFLSKPVAQKVANFLHHRGTDMQSHPNHVPIATNAVEDNYPDDYHTDNNQGMVKSNINR